MRGGCVCLNPPNQWKAGLGSTGLQSQHSYCKNQRWRRGPWKLADASSSNIKRPCKQEGRRDWYLRLPSYLHICSAMYTHSREWAQLKCGMWKVPSSHLHPHLYFYSCVTERVTFEKLCKGIGWDPRLPQDRSISCLDGWKPFMLIEIGGYFLEYYSN